MPAARSVRLPHAVRLSAVLAIGLTAGFVTWFLVSDSSGRPTAATVGHAIGPATGKTATVPVTEQGLRTLAGALKQPIYWAGPKRGYQLELTQASDGRVFIRYLPRGTDIGTNKPFLTIGTYLLQNAYPVTESAATRSDSVRVKTTAGIAFYSKQTPTNVYVAYPSSDVQVEVDDPWAPDARRLVESGTVTPVPAINPAPGLRTAPQDLTLSSLKSFAQRVAHPVYWTGPQPRTTYEVTQTAQGGQIFIRYLPTGTPAGIDKPYLTIATYPVANALQITRQLASKPGSAQLPVTQGAIAFYARSRPTNIYEAWPGTNYQIEVYDPSVTQGQHLVKTNRILPIP